MKKFINKLIEKYGKKKLIIILCAVVGCGVIIGLGFGFAAIPFKGKASTEKFDKNKTFSLSEDVAASFDISKGKHEEGFVILNLADIQLNNLELGEQNDSFRLLTKLINETNPDLITLTGDQISGAYTRNALKKICQFLDETGIPWAPVLGNHDGQGDVTRNGNGDIFLDYKNVVFRKNDPSLGVGNYIINLTDGDKPIHAVFMVDSHDTRKYKGDKKKDYDYIWETQIDWYEWAVKGLQQTNADVKSSMYFHIPLVQYKMALQDLGYENGRLGDHPDGVEFEHGFWCEDICCPRHSVKDGLGHDSGMFARIKELGSTDLVVAGHDHTNNFATEYDGVTLAYGTKSGYGSYYKEERVGGTTITIAKDGSHTLQNYYYNRANDTLTKAN